MNSSENDSPGDNESSDDGRIRGETTDDDQESGGNLIINDGSSQDQNTQESDRVEVNICKLNSTVNIIFSTYFPFNNDQTYQESLSNYINVKHCSVIMSVVKVKVNIHESFV